MSIVDNRWFIPSVIVLLTSFLIVGILIIWNSQPQIEIEETEINIKVNSNSTITNFTGNLSSWTVSGATHESLDCTKYEKVGFPYAFESKRGCVDLSDEKLNNVLLQEMIELQKQEICFNFYSHLSKNNQIIKCGDPAKDQTITVCNSLEDCDNYCREGKFFNYKTYTCDWDLDR